MEEATQDPRLVPDADGVLRRCLNDLEVVPRQESFEPPCQEELDGQSREEEKEKESPRLQAGRTELLRRGTGIRRSGPVFGCQALRSRNGRTRAKRPATASASRRAEAIVPSSATIK